MMRIGKFRKAPADRKRYEINYADWLNVDEVVEGVVMAGDVPDDEFYVDGYVVSQDGKSVVFYVSGGLSGEEYQADVTIDTSLSQRKQDWITFVVT